MSVKEEFQSIRKRLDEIRELLINGPQEQDSAEFGQSETAGDDAEIVDDEMANEVGRLREELRLARQAQATLQGERDHFIERAKEQGARLSQAQDQRDELQRWINQLQAERYQAPQEDLVTIPAEEFDDLRNAKKERDTLRDHNTKLGEECSQRQQQVNQIAKERDQLTAELERARAPQGGDRQQLDQAREEIYKLRASRDVYQTQCNKLARERDQESARAAKTERQRDQLMSRNRELMERYRQAGHDHEQEKAEIRKERDEAREAERKAPRGARRS